MRPATRDAVISPAITVVTAEQYLVCVAWADQLCHRGFER